MYKIELDVYSEFCGHNLRNHKNYSSNRSLIPEWLDDANVTRIPTENMAQPRKRN